ncbi:unnamed protein product, partial [Staurois parvus]
MWLQQHLYTEHLPAAPALDFRGAARLPPSPVIGRLCAFPELQFWHQSPVRRRSQAAARTSSG